MREIKPQEKCYSIDEVNHLIAEKDKLIQKLQSENAALRERLDRSVELPCKVGDTIYEVFKYHKPPFIQQTKVEKIIVTEKGLRLKLARNSFYETSIASLGKTLFLTEESAEARLKELQDKEDCP